MSAVGRPTQSLWSGRCPTQRAHIAFPWPPRRGPTDPILWGYSEIAVVLVSGLPELTIVRIFGFFVQRDRQQYELGGFRSSVGTEDRRRPSLASCRRKGLRLNGADRDVHAGESWGGFSFPSYLFTYVLDLQGIAQNRLQRLIGRKKKPGHSTDRVPSSQHFGKVVLT